MVLQCSIIFGFLALGELIVSLTGVPLPSSIIGMVLLTCSLKAGIIKVEWVEKLADFLIRNLGFFFVPAGVGLMECAGIIKSQWIPIVVATVVSTALIIAATGHVHQRVRNSTRHHSHD